MFKVFNGHSGDSFVTVNSDGCVELSCYDSYFSGKLSRADSVELARCCMQPNDFTYCKCTHQKGVHLADGCGICDCETFDPAPGNPEPEPYDVRVKTPRCTSAHLVRIPYPDEPKPIVQTDKQLLERYRTIAYRIWELYDSDPLGDGHARFMTDRLEAILDRGLLVPRAEPTEEKHHAE